MQQKIGVLIVNLGTPLSPSARDIRRYLKSFLSDPRVVEIPRLVWWFILNVIILNLRPKKVAVLYKKIWGVDGSPLRVNTLNLLENLKDLAAAEPIPATLAFEGAMTYGEPSMLAALAHFQQQSIDNIIVIPLFPQFSATTQGPVFDQLFAFYKCKRNIPALFLLRDFSSDDFFVEVLANHIKRFREVHERPDLLVFSFHGIPQGYVDKGDPYFDRCKQTALLLVEKLGLREDEWTIAFQSRFGRTPWLQPYLFEVLPMLPKKGIKKIQIICPGFLSDCLETLEEINVESRHLFLEAGGECFEYIPCLNDSVEFSSMLWGKIKKITTAFLA